MRKSQRGRWAGRALVGLVAAWFVVLGLGFQRVLAHGAEAGQDAVAPPRWPGAPQLQQDAERASLVLFVHPMCPCTIASLRELGRLLPRLGDRASATVLVRLPAAPDSDWETGESWRLARSLPGVHVVPDPGGALTEKFGAVTSGHVLVYTPSGRLTFSGGITAGRGHEGAAAGQSAIFEAIHTEHRSLTARVFGCELFEKL